jgi:signal transduction histidine kinase
VARNQVAKLVSLVEDLLEVADSSEGRIELERESLDLAELAQAVAQRLEPAAARAGCALVLDAPSPVPGEWDRARLEQVLTHLLTNAFRFGPHAPVRLSVQAEPGGAQLSVVDRGIGLAAADRERIFEKFARAVPDRHYGGLGLGLYLTRQIVEALGGSIEVHSAEGQGASFTVHLPRACESTTATVH